MRSHAFVRYGPTKVVRQKVPQQQKQQQQQQPPAQPQSTKVKKVTKPKKYVPPPPPAPAGAPQAHHRPVPVPAVPAAAAFPTGVPPPHHKKQPVPVRPRHVPAGVRPGARPAQGHRVPPTKQHQRHRQQQQQQQRPQFKQQRPQQFKRKPAVPAHAVPAVPAGVPAVPPPQLKREVKKVLLKKVPVAVVKALPPKKQVDPTRYLFPPYVAPASIRQPSNAGARDKRKTPAAVANGLALSTTDFLAEHENDREEARAAASKLVPKTVPAPSKFQKNAPPPPKRVGRQIKNQPSAVPSPTRPQQLTRPARDIGNGGGSSGGFSGIFSSIKQRFGFKPKSQRRPAQAPRHHRRPHPPHREHPQAVRRQYKKQIPAQQSQSKLPYANPENIHGYQTFTLAEVITPDKAAARSDDSKVIKVIEASDVTPSKREKKELDAQENVKDDTTEAKKKKRKTTTTTSEKKDVKQR